MKTKKAGLARLIIIGILVCISISTFAGCETFKEGLNSSSSQAESFSYDGGYYSINLPKNWSKGDAENSFKHNGSIIVDGTDENKVISGAITISKQDKKEDIDYLTLTDEYLTEIVSDKIKNIDIDWKKINGQVAYEIKGVGIDDEKSLYTVYIINTPENHIVRVYYISNVREDAVINSILAMKIK